MGAFLKSALNIDVKNNLKRSTLVTSKSDTTSQRQMWSDGSDDQVWEAEVA